MFKLFDADRGNSLSLKEIKLAICAGRNLDDRVWLAGVNSGFDDKAMASALNADISVVDDPNKLGLS